MAMFKINNDQLIPIERTTFSRLGMRERQDLQTLLRKQIDAVSPETLIVAEEFGDWEGVRRRIDLLGVDKNANLVVIELKRTEDGGHMELQAIRYAAMISTLTFEKLAAIYEKYLSANGIEQDATENLLEFLDWSEVDDEQFGQEIKIVLASAEFSKELTTSVMWLNDFGLDIRCVRMRPYTTDGQTFLDIQTVIPIPEVADYQVQIREKKYKERKSRQSAKDYTKYDVEISDEQFPMQGKRWMMFHLISRVLRNDGTPQQIMEAIPWRKNNQLFRVFEGELSSDDVVTAIMEEDSGGRIPLYKRYFCDEGEVFHFDGMTYALSNQWGNRTIEAVNSISEMFPHLEIKVKPAEE